MSPLATSLATFPQRTILCSSGKHFKPILWFNDTDLHFCRTCFFLNMGFLKSHDMLILLLFLENPHSLQRYGINFEVPVVAQCELNLILQPDQKGPEFWTWSRSRPKCQNDPEKVWILLNSDQVSVILRSVLTFVLKKWNWLLIYAVLVFLNKFSSEWAVFQNWSRKGPELANKSRFLPS